MANYTKGISRKNVKVPDLESFDCPGHISEFRAEMLLGSTLSLW